IFPKKIVFTFGNTKKTKKKKEENKERLRKRYVIFGLESRTNNGFEELKPVELKSKPRLLHRRQLCSFFVFLQRRHGLTAAAATAGRSTADFRAVADVRRSGDFLAHHLSAHGVESTEHRIHYLKN
ncbi:unnamed protein product, partial [Brassica oleracea]